ncbi:MAG: TonB-dependent receptor, partial [Rudanella sp.]|nr:TonB-dependent receptor [Rudanella sp.]
MFVRFLRFMLCFALLAGHFQCVLAQNIPPYSLQGTLLDTTGKQIADQSVCLYRDSTLVTITVSGSDGRFLFGKLTPGGYRLVVVRPGYSPVSQTIQVTDAPLTRDLSLVAGVTQLKEVTVTARKPEVEIKPDRVVVNLEANGLLAGQTVLDAFAVAPRAMLDAITKTIQVDGQPVTQLYVNDKRVALPANGVSAYLQTLPASTYTRMEILTVPPASYDASGGSVVLLYTKRPPTDGLTGDLQLSLGYGRYEKANASGNMSWKMARHSGFAVLTPLWKPTYFQYVSHQNLGGTGYSDAEQFRTNRQASLGFQSGIDVTLSPKTTVGAALNASTMHYQLRPDAWVHYQVSGQPSVGIHSISVSDQQYRQASLNLNLRHILPTGGRVSVDGDWAGFLDRHQTGSEFTRQVNSIPVNESVTIFYPTTMKIASLKADYARTVHGVTWESGIKYSLVAMQNQPVAEKVSPGFDPLKSALTLAYHYREQTAALYGSAAFSWQSWSVNAGLRTEATWYSGQSSGTGSEPLLVSRQYTYLFPTLSLSYPLNKQVQLTLAANRRIVRPNFDLLNPAYLILDAITYVQGNPFLRPTLNTTYQAVLQLPKRISLSLIHLDAKQRLVEVLY